MSCVECRGIRLRTEGDRAVFDKLRGVQRDTFEDRER